MLADVLRAVPTEINFINGAIVSEAERLGVPTPVNSTIRQLLHLRENSPKANAFKPGWTLQVRAVRNYGNSNELKMIYFLAVVGWIMRLYKKGLDVHLE